MNDQKASCIFAGQYRNSKNKACCSALREYVCDKRKCPFYKSKMEYYQDIFMNVRKW